MDLEFFVIGEGGASWWEWVLVVPNAGDLVHRGDDVYKVLRRTFSDGCVEVMLQQINYDTEEIPY